MLYNVKIGSGDMDWTQSEDKYGNIIISDSSINQRIRAAKNFDSGWDYITPIAKNGDETLSTSSYKLANKVKIVRNNNNLGMLIVGSKEGDPNDYLYLTINNEEYELLNYKYMNCDIIQSYKKKAKYQGCCIAFDVNEFNDLSAGGVYPLIQVTLLNKLTEDKNVEVFDVLYDANDTQTIICQTSDIYSIFYKVSYGVYDENRKFTHFKMSDCYGIVTSTIITTEANEALIEEKLGENSPNKNNKMQNSIIVLTEEEKKLVENGNYAESEALMSILNESVTDRNIKAVTVCDVKLNPAFLKEFNILYLLKYDKDKDISYVLRSA